MNSASLTWEFVDRLKKLTQMKLLIKGLLTQEDWSWFICVRYFNI